MFQYATGLAASKRLGTELELNTYQFHSDPIRQYSLKLWNGITEDVSSYPPQKIVIREEGLPYNQQIVDRMTSDCAIYGYWQTEKYFSGIKKELKEIFRPKQDLTDKAKQTLQAIKSAGHRSTFLTIRRTDYLKLDFHGVLPAEYYADALKKLSEKVDPILFVFSDEPDWCKENLKFPCPIFVCGNYDQTTPTHLGREDSELFLMNHCHNAIMANSTYSWWGAWLGADDLGGTIIRPKRWFYKAEEDSSDICPSRWLAL